MENGIHKLRINPGNIERQEDVRRVVDCAKAHKVPIRIGVNTGSLPKDLVASMGVTPDSMVEAALRTSASWRRAGFSTSRSRSRPRTCGPTCSPTGRWPNCATIPCTWG